MALKATHNSMFFWLVARICDSSGAKNQEKPGLGRSQGLLMSCDVEFRRMDWVIQCFGILEFVGGTG